MPDYIVIAVIIITVWNMIVFALYGSDKRKSKLNKWRISESTLLLSAAFMGGIGALLGMRVFRHKTKHLKFRIGVPLLLVLNLVIAAAVIYLYVLRNN